LIDTHSRVIADFSSNGRTISKSRIFAERWRKQWRNACRCPRAYCRTSGRFKRAQENEAKKTAGAEVSSLRRRSGGSSMGKTLNQ